ncbi:psmD13 [Symbiodinium sp. CCMP2456]|nr:psmD13 [Symbiodinium sp. CCMP2456]
MSLIEGDKFVNAEGAIFLQRAAPPEFYCALGASGQIMETRALPGAILAQVTDQPPQASARSSEKLRDQSRRGRMDVDPSPALEAQRKAHPELSEQLDKMQKFVNSKLYHQLTQTLLEYLVSPPFAAATPAVAAELKDFFEGFIKAFEVRFDKVRWVQILSIVAKPQTPAVALELIAPFEATMAENRDAKFLCQALKGEKLILSADTESAKELLENLGLEIDNAYEVQALIQSHFHKTNALLWKTLGRSQEFYKSSILYLAFTPLEAIPMEERPQIAFDTVIAALVAEEEFNFGELTQQAIIQSLDGSPFAWVRDLLQAFSEGKFDLFDAAIAKNRTQMEASPELKSAEATLRRKMCALSLMELAFRQVETGRRDGVAFQTLQMLVREYANATIRYKLTRTYFGNEGKEPDVLYPWPLRDLAAERLQEAAAKKRPTHALRDGLGFLVEASPSALPAGVEAGVFVGLFSLSYTSNEDKVEDWMVSGGTPPKHNPIRLWSMFSYQYSETRGRVQPDELGDSCFGENWRAELCARVWTCFIGRGKEGIGGGRWRVAAGVRFAATYRIEAYLGPPLSSCRSYLSDEEQQLHPPVSWWAPPVSEHTVESMSSVVQHAAWSQLRLLYVNRENYWWGQQAQVQPASCWLDLMQAAVHSASLAPAAAPERLGRQPTPDSPHGLWLEFGVGSGKTTAAIAFQMKAMVGKEAILHGFDSFEGLPSDWDHTHLAAGTFSRGGKIPEHLLEMPNVKIHVGLFSDTLGDLDQFGDMPVAFAHIDVDIFPSAVEVLSRIACQLWPGSVLVYDELVNYVGFELSGEYRAWEYVASAYGIGWQYAGMYWQQAVPMIITERGRQRMSVCPRSLSQKKGHSVSMWKESKVVIIDSSSRFTAATISYQSLKASCNTSERSLSQPMPCLLLAQFAVQMGAKRRQRQEMHTSAPELKVEHLVMRSMCAELIRGQIDEAETEAFQPMLRRLKVSELVTVTWVKPRILDPVRIDLMRERMDAWASQTGLLLEHLEQVTPELLVSADSDALLRRHLPKTPNPKMAAEVQKEASSFPSLASLWPFASDAGKAAEETPQERPETRNAAEPAEAAAEPSKPSTAQLGQSRASASLRPPSGSDDAEAAGSLPLPTSRSLRESAISSTPQGSPSSRRARTGRESSGEPGSPGARFSAARASVEGQVA